MNNVLFVLGGLAIGGVETYIVRLSEQLAKNGCKVDVLLLSNKVDDKLFVELQKYATIFEHEFFPFLNASSWLNVYFPFKFSDKVYDLVHVVDLLTLSFVNFNNKAINYKSLSIGIYHSMEICWWADKDCYFRKKMLDIYHRNIELTLFPSESILQLAKTNLDIDSDNFSIVPLGIKLPQSDNLSGCRKSRKIVSVGRLVDFKIYNKHIISQLAEIRKSGDFEYFIYGSGPEKGNLVKLAKELGVEAYVHFMGEIEYSKISTVFKDAFCFVGSGTVLIEASATGLPAIVGIESISTPHTCGFFSEIVGYSYNEEFATKKRISFADAIHSLVELSEEDYRLLSIAHREKAEEFDIINTVDVFLSSSNKKPIFDVSFNRFRGFFSFFSSLLRYGPSALKNRFDKG